LCPTELVSCFKTRRGSKWSRCKAHRASRVLTSFTIVVPLEECILFIWLHVVKRFVTCAHQYGLSFDEGLADVVIQGPSTRSINSRFFCASLLVDATCRQTYSESSTNFCRPTQQERLRRKTDRTISYG